MKYLDLFRRQFKERTAFTIHDVRKVLSGKGISPLYLNTFISHLIKKGEIRQVTRGVYTYKNEVQVVGFAYQPFYYGLQDALSLRNIWEQETNPIVLTTRKVRTGLRKFSGANYLVRRIQRKLFFGFEMIKYYDFWVPVADMEKTIIDFVYFRHKIPDEVMSEMKRNVRTDVMADYLGRVPEWLRKRVRKLLEFQSKQ